MLMFEFTIKGLVQGVGYRPFIARLGEKLGLSGDVHNAGGIVIVRAGFESEEEAQGFAERLRRDFPKGARVESVEVSKAEEESKAPGFKVIESDDNNIIPTLPADIGVCPDCLKELRDKNSRFYRYPFISCAACGPRATIMHRIPYDRHNTTMDKFEMCPGCRAEYYNEGNRRFYAQTISCHHCGPKLWLWEKSGEDETEIKTQEKTPSTKTGAEAYEAALKLLKAGKVIAVKNVGGYHIVCDASDDNAVRKIRELKNRETKPFALLVKDVATAEKLALFSDNAGDGKSDGEKERNLLESSARPVVLLSKKSSTGEEIKISLRVSMNSPYIGLMLPANGLQYMLSEEIPALVMTSANYSGEPIICDDEEIKKFGIPVLGNDRQILAPLDDSVMRVVCGRVQCLRRSRGFVPEPVEIPGLPADNDSDSIEIPDLYEEENPNPAETVHNKKIIFAAGADLKSAFAFGNEGKIYLGRYLGDLENLRVQWEYVNSVRNMASLHRTGAQAEKIVTDLHPAYVSANLGKNLNHILSSASDVKADYAPKIIKVQHHMAHAASVMAEHGIKGPALCFAFDGTGYGLDGTVWGGEVFAFDGVHLKRVDHLDCVTLPGGDEGVRNANLSLAGYIHELKMKAENDPEKTENNPAEYEGSSIYSYGDIFEPGAENMVYRALDLQINSVKSTSCGRLFDAVAALLGIATYNHYEGECACELEYAAAGAERKQGSDSARNKAASRPLSSTEILKYLIERKLSGADPAELAYEFHDLLSDWIVLKSTKLCEGGIILSGGCFANRLLTGLCIKKLESEGFLVYTSERVPPGDDGIALGQIFLGKE